MVAGPTGTGKSDLALDLAERLTGEIVNADSMQLYRGMDIGTAKVPPADRRGVPHHLLDVLDIADVATVASYQRDATAAITGIRDRGRTPILVGGSGLYIQAVVDRIEFPATDPVVRGTVGGGAGRGRCRRIVPPARRTGPGRRHCHRTGQRPEDRPRAGGHRAHRPAVHGDHAATGHPGVRGRCTCGWTGRPISWTSGSSDRVRLMVDAGFLDEVRTLDAAGLRTGVTASRALGYAQLLAVLDGELDMPAAITATAAATRRFVRRQRSWFRRDHRMLDLDASEPNLADRAMAMLADAAAVG